VKKQRVRKAAFGRAAMVKLAQFIVQNIPMRFDHISYVTSHDQLADTVQRLGSRLGTTFVDGGIHPRFGTRNFTAPLLNGQYIEVVCPLDHPAADSTPWGRAVSKKSLEGGGWFTWVFSTQDIETLSKEFGREAAEGHRFRPNGTELRWKQIGVSEITENPQLPFFIQWLTSDHPSTDGVAVAKVHEIILADQNKLTDSWFREQILSSLGSIKLSWIEESKNDGEVGIAKVIIETSDGMVEID